MYSNKKTKYTLFFLIIIGFVFTFIGCESKSNLGKSKKITVVSYGGGAYQESHKTAFCKPFSFFTGYFVDSTTWGADYGKLKAMVNSKKVPWDVVEVTSAQFARGSREKLYEPLTIKPESKDFLKNSISDFGIANVYWGTVLAYKKSAFATNPPQNWADFFDIQHYPGSRALYDDPRATLEFALLADGVKPDKLYPLDIDRAFKKLDKIKPYIRVWWSDSSQPVQLLMTGSVVMSSVWNGRIFASAEAKKEIGYTWNGAALELDYWVIPKGSLNRDIASRFILYASSSYAMAKQAEMVGYGPVNIDSLNYINANVRKELPTTEENFKNSFVVDANWWADNEETVKTKWLSWKAK